MIAFHQHGTGTDVYKRQLLDRANPLYPSDYRFRDIYMLTSAAENEEYVPERAVAGLTGWIDCFEKAQMCIRDSLSDLQ